MGNKKIKTNKRSSTLPSPPPKREKVEFEHIEHEESESSVNCSEVEADDSELSADEDVEMEDEANKASDQTIDQPLEKSSVPSETLKTLQELLTKLRRNISPELSECFDSNPAPADSLIITLESFSKEHKSTSKSSKSNPDYESRIIAIRKRLASVYSLTLRSLTNVRPYYQTSSTNLFDSIEAVASKSDDFSRECALSKMWHPLAQINSRLQRSVLILNRDPTVLGSVTFSETEKEVASASQQAFRDFYMESLTENYGDDLDKLREEEGFNQARLEMLIDSLESGMTLFPESDRDLLMLPSH